MLETVLFYLLSTLAVASAVGVVICRSAVYSLLCLVATMCLVAGLFVQLKAFLAAIVLVLVYAGAILVLFLFVVMLVDFRKLSQDWQGLGFKRVWAILACGILFLEFFKAISSVALVPAAAKDGTAEALGQALFNDYLLPFELTSILVLSAVTSVVVLAKKNKETSL